jgi:CheY-like chemotaxis protein
LPALALTAFSRPQDRADALAAGFQVHLVKPVNADSLISSIASLTRAAQAPGG